MTIARTLLAWLIAGGVGYGLAAISSHNVNLNQLAALGADIPLGERLHTTADAVWKMWAYHKFTGFPTVVLVSLGIAFPVAWVIKQLVKPLAVVAYPIAGAAAMMAQLELMKMVFGLYPLLGAQTGFGYALHVASGAVAGGVFELLRARPDMTLGGAPFMRPSSPAAGG